MEHIVFYTGLDSTAQFRRVPSLDEAARFVESLRNGEGVDDSVVFSMTQVPLRFQTYYRVELPGDATSPAADAAPPAAEPARDEPAPAVEPATPVDALTAMPDPADFSAAPIEPAPTATEPPPVAPEVVPVPVVEDVPVEIFEPVADSTPSPEMPSIEAITAAPVLPDAPAGDVVEPSANGKPNRGLGFFAR